MVINLVAEVFSFGFKTTHNLTPWLWRICSWAWAGVQVPMELGQGGLSVLSHWPSSTSAAGSQGLRPTVFSHSCQGTQKPSWKNNLKKRKKSKHAVVHIFLLATICKPGYSAKGLHSKKEPCSGKQTVYSYSKFLTLNLLHGPGAVSPNIAFKYCLQK